MTTFTGSTPYEVVAAGSTVFNGSTPYSVVGPTNTFYGSTPYVVTEGSGAAQAFQRVGDELVPIRLGKRRGSVIDWLTPPL